MGAAQGIHVVAKPAGPVCNLNCEYSFYFEKQVLFGTSGQNRMPDSVLSAFISNYVSSQSTPVVEFVRQGGEPTLQGKDFFKSVVELQKPFTRLKTELTAVAGKRPACFVCHGCGKRAAGHNTRTIL